ncbi:MAG: T9SS type A sorting domain-containing protein [Chitinophagaceae bacterium]|nr:T9SS type A sorting domain-containing protein [Chitinophagaceae bacterium]
MKRNFTISVFAFIIGITTSFAQSTVGSFAEDTTSFYLTRQVNGNTVLTKLTFPGKGVISPVDIRTYNGLLLNATGYYRGYIWAMGHTPSSRVVYKLHANGNIENWSIPQLPVSGWNTAVVDTSGIMYLIPGGSSIIYQLDLTSGVPVYKGSVQLTGSFVLGSGDTFGDLLFDPITRKLYGWFNDINGTTGGLYEINKTTGSALKIGAASTRSVGSLIGFDGIFIYGYGSAENSGTIQDRFIKMSASTGEITELAQSIAVSQSDGCQFSGTITRQLSLPVKMSYFSAMRNKNGVSLYWKTETETNNNYFEIQRSEDGAEFKPIALMFAKEDAANGASYQYNDYSLGNINGNMVWYRLKQVDIDGKFTYTALKKVNLNDNAKGVKMQLSPNPFQGPVQLRFESDKKKAIDLRIYNTAGQVMYTSRIDAKQGLNAVQVNEASRLMRGMYMIELWAEGELMDQQKIVKQ